MSEADKALERWLQRAQPPAEPRSEAPKAAPPTPQEAQRSFAGTPGEMDSGANAAGYAFLDKATLGGLPWLRDKIADMAGNTTQLRRDEQRAYDEQNHPIAQTAGNVGGTVLPALAGVGGMAKAGAAIGENIAGRALGSTLGSNVLGAGAANLADQGARAVLDDKPFDPADAALSAASGALAAPLQAGKLIFGAHNPLVAGGAWALRKGIERVAGAADEATQAGVRAAGSASREAAGATAARQAAGAAQDAAMAAKPPPVEPGPIGARYSGGGGRPFTAEPLPGAQMPGAKPPPDMGVPFGPHGPVMDIPAGKIRPSDMGGPGSPLYEELSRRIREGAGKRGSAPFADPIAGAPPPMPPPAGVVGPPPWKTVPGVAAKESLDTLSGEAEQEKRRRRLKASR